MKARTKIEKQVAASNEKLTALSPKVLTWAVRKVAGHRSEERRVGKEC